MKFEYKAKKDGKILQGIFDAQNKFEVYDFLKEQGAELIYVREKDVNAIEKLNNIFSRIKLRDKILFADNIATMLSAGLSLSRALSVAKKQTSNIRFKGIISSIQSDVEKGESFHGALAKHKTFSKLFISMVRAGEVSGNLPQALKSVALQLDRVDSLRKKVKGAMIYPAIIVFAITIIGIFMMVSVVPTLSKTFKEMNVELPLATKLIINISDFLKYNFFLFLSFAFVFFLAMFFFLRTEKGAWFKSFVFLHIPIIKNITKELNTARIARTLSSLLSAGVDVIESVKISAEVTQNMYFKKALTDMQEKIQKGKPISETLANYEELFPSMFIELVAVGEETGSVQDMMLKVADYYEEEVNSKTKNMSTIIEPFLMLFIGIAVGFFAYAMIVPMYSITNSI